MQEDIKEHISLNKTVLSSQEIKKILPHRYPFQLVDKIVHIEDSLIIGVKNVTINEPFFQGHFPNEPVMPGVLQVEAMIQTGGILALKHYESKNAGKLEDYSTYFLSIDKCKFRAKVIPGDTLILKCKLLGSIRMGIAKFEGKAFVDNKLVSEAIMIASITNNK